MIAAVYGSIDSGERIDFTLNSNTGLWEATAPETLKGIYYVEIYAEDHAGNVTYIASALCTIDMTRVCIVTDVAECDAGVDDNRSMSVTVSDCTAEVDTGNEHMIDVLTSACDIDVIRCDICGRW